MSTIVLKIGGSAITKKDQFETLKPDALEKTAQQISSALNADSPPSLVIVHGAGSFGHFQASRFKLSSGGDEVSWTIGLAETRQSVLKLNAEVLSSMLKLRVPASTVSLFPLCNTRDLVLAEEGPLLSIQNLIAKNIVPILHGDVVLDYTRRCSVFGGDKIMLW